MPRAARFVLPGQPHHVIHRGNNRQPIFVDDEDCRLFMKALAMASARQDCAIHAYALMTNHIHLLVTPREANGLGEMMRRVNSIYVQPFNRRHGRSGSLWEGRFRSGPIDSEAYLLTCMRYIDLNPVRAGMADMPGEYPWTSYGFNARGDEDALLRPHAVYKRLGRDAAGRQSEYRQLCQQRLPEQELDRIGKAANNSWALGSDKYLAKLEARLGRPAGPRSRGGDRKSRTFRNR